MCTTVTLSNKSLDSVIIRILLLNFTGNQMIGHFTQLELMASLFNGSIKPNLKSNNGNAGNGHRPIQSILQVYMREVPGHF